MSEDPVDPPRDEASPDASDGAGEAGGPGEGDPATAAESTTVATVGDHEVSRRDLLLASGVALGLGATGGLGYWALQREGDAPTEAVPAERARELAEQFAPTYYFDALEEWYPTDPRPYEREGEDGPVVDGFDAFDGYTQRFQEQGQPPNPTVFYNARTYEESSLAVVQYFWYAAFDQFTVNFHWHDWELVQVFVDLETEAVQLYDASAHSRKVPNNEFLDPEREDGPRILPELGSHSSGLSVNEAADRFTRIGVGDLTPDITNSELDVGFEISSAYGLPRDEQLAVPFVVPELDGEPIHEHERLPAVTEDTLIRDGLVVESFQELSSPPRDLPTRETGQVWAHESDAAEGELAPDGEHDVDVNYDLIPTTELDHITNFTGPQLSFTFQIPAAIEDQFSKHISTSGVPWDQPRYENPADDISDPQHRQALADRYDAIGEPAPVHRLVGVVRETAAASQAPPGEGLTMGAPTLEVIALIQSDPVAVPSFKGVVVAQGIESGEHQITVNGPGLAPHSEPVQVVGGQDTQLAGVEGTVPLTPNEAAVKLEVIDGGEGPPIERLAVADDFAGRLYDATFEDEDAVYVHQDGAYTIEIADANGNVGFERVVPAEGADRVQLEAPPTGVRAVANFVIDTVLHADATIRADAGIEEERREVVIEDTTDDTTDDTGTGDNTTTTETPTRETTTTETTENSTSDDQVTDTPLGARATAPEIIEGHLGVGASETRRSRAPSVHVPTAVWDLLDALRALERLARRAILRADAGDASVARNWLLAVADETETTEERLDAAADALDEATVAALRRRLDRIRQSAAQGAESDRL